MLSVVRSRLSFKVQTANKKAHILRRAQDGAGAGGMAWAVLSGRGPAQRPATAIYPHYGGPSSDTVRPIGVPGDLGQAGARQTRTSRFYKEITTCQYVHKQYFYMLPKSKRRIGLWRAAGGEREKTVGALGNLKVHCD
jgi:hypothetical protein